jgi:hypothetical protein
VLQRRREAGDHEVQQLGRADGVGGVHRQYRVERAPRHRALEVLDQHRAVDLLAADVPLHQRLVLRLLDHRLDQRTALLVVLVVGCVVAQQADQLVVLAQVDRNHLVAERGLRLQHHAVVVGTSVVELGDHHDARHADLRALAPQRLGRLVDPLVGGDHEQRAVGGAEPGTQLAHEVGVPGGVQQVDLHAAVHQRRERESGGALLAELRLVEVADGRAVEDRSWPVQHTGRDQKGLDQCRLA